MMQMHYFALIQRIAAQVPLEAATGRDSRRMDVLRTAIFHEKACFVKANVVAITLERLICPVATLPFALSSSPSSATRCMMGSVFSGRRCNLKTGLPPREGPRQLAQSPEPDVGRAAAAAAATAAAAAAAS